MKPTESSVEFLAEADRANHIARVDEREELINLGGNYDYLSRAYYVSRDLEHAGKPIRPNCRQMLDAYVPPLFLEKARLANVPIPEFYISNGFFEPPAIVDPINPFTLRGRVVMKPGRVKTISRSLTRNHTYAVCCQEIPPQARVIRFRAILGWTVSPSLREAAAMVWNVFSIPLATVRALKLEDGSVLLSDIAPLYLEDLKPREMHHLKERVKWVN
ncbi:MAG TPA: RimK-like ATPgrasp N-terminal domain-containing protein [candidate division Zixibacteria bacterium]|nr:RimK-like ATPgrasp N-terminal domain-containing protein [candidate division Zixibacteria bacterium]